MHIAAGRAANQLPVRVDDLLVDVYFYLEKSSKRKQEFKDFQKKAGVPLHKVLKHVSTRWLSLGHCIERLLEQWNALLAFFKEEEKKATCTGKRSRTDSITCPAKKQKTIAPGTSQEAQVPLRNKSTLKTAIKKQQTSTSIAGTSKNTALPVTAKSSTQKSAQVPLTVKPMLLKSLKSAKQQTLTSIAGTSKNTALPVTAKSSTQKSAQVPLTVKPMLLKSLKSAKQQTLTSIAGTSKNTALPVIAKTSTQKSAQVPLTVKPMLLKSLKSAKQQTLTSIAGTSKNTALPVTAKTSTQKSAQVPLTFKPTLKSAKQQTSTSIAGTSKNTALPVATNSSTQKSAKQQDSTSISKTSQKAQATGAKATSSLKAGSIKAPGPKTPISAFASSKVKNVVNMMTNPNVKLYSLFLSETIPIFEDANIILQKDEPCIHRLHRVMCNQLRELLIRFVKPAVVMAQSKTYEVDFRTAENQKTDDELYIGHKARTFLSEYYCDVKEFYQSVRKYYVAACDYMKKAYPFKEKILINAEILDVTKRATTALHQWLFFAQRFPQSLSANEKESLEQEFCRFQVEEFSDDIIQAERVDQAWHFISKIISPATGLPKYPTMSKIARLIVVMYHSNADCERIFSLVNKNKTEFRSLLSTNMLGNLMTRRMDLMSSGTPCYSVKYSQELLAKAKSATAAGLRASGH